LLLPLHSFPTRRSSDLYFFINSLLIEILTILTLRPALVLFHWARVGWVSTTVVSLPLVVQVPALLLVADFTQYWVHRTFHVVSLDRKSTRLNSSHLVIS